MNILLGGKKCVFVFRDKVGGQKKKGEIESEKERVEWVDQLK